MRLLCIPMVGYNDVISSFVINNSSSLLVIINLVGGFKHVLLSIIYGMSSFPLTNSYFSEGWLNHQPVIILNQLQSWWIPISNGSIRIHSCRSYGFFFGMILLWGYPINVIAGWVISWKIPSING